MSILLDAARACAALMVLVGHMVQMEIYTGPFPFSAMMQHYAVIVFFVLSGLVIVHSVEARSTTLGEYAIARAARILPVSLAALAFGTLVFIVVSAQGLAPTLTPEPYDRLTLTALLLPVVFLSESWHGVGPAWNPPYWSLVYEVWFYAIFGAAYFLKGRTRIAAVLLLCVVAGWRILLMMPIWWLGAALARRGGAPFMAPERAVLIALGGVLAMILADAFSVVAYRLMVMLHDPAGYDLRYSLYFLTDWVFAIGIAMLFIAARPLAEAARPLLERFQHQILWLSGLSFSLYLFHWPMLSVLSAFGIGAGDSVPAFAALAGGVVGLCALIATVTEHRSRDIREWMRRRFAGAGRTATA